MPEDMPDRMPEGINVMVGITRSKAILASVFFVSLFFCFSLHFHTLHFRLCTLHFTFTLYTLHFTLETWHSTLYTPHFTLHTLHCTLHTLHSTFQTLHSILYTSHSTLDTWHSTLYTPHTTPYTLDCELYTVHSTFHTLHSTLHNPKVIPYTSLRITFPIPHSTVYTGRVTGHMYKTVEITWFTNMFYVTAFGFVGFSCLVILHPICSMVLEYLRTFTL